MHCNFTTRIDHFPTSSHQKQPLPFDAFFVTRSLNKVQRDQIERSITSFGDSSELLPILDAAEGMKEIALDFENYKVYPILGLQALFKTEITEEQFSTICMLYNAIDQMIISPARFETFYNPETKESVTYRLDLPKTAYKNAPIATHYIHSLSYQEKAYFQQFFRLNETGMGRMIHFLKSAPHSEHFFYSIQLPDGALINCSPLYHRITEVMSFFGPVDSYRSSSKEVVSPLQPKRILIPSFSMFKCFFQIAFGSSSFQLQTILGDVTDEMLDEHKQQGIRLINIGVPGIDVPEMADGFFGGKWVFILHDFYHALRDSSIPKPMQQALCRISKILAKFMEEHRDEKKLITGCQKVKRRLTDGELFDYDPNRSAEASRKHVNIKVLFERTAFPKELKAKIVQDIANNPYEWKKKYHITLDQIYTS